MPDIFFIFKEEYWGKGYGSEAIKNSVQYWASLPRKEVYHTMDPVYLNFPPENSQVAEYLQATIDNRHKRSEGVLLNSGFTKHHNNGEDYFWKLLMQ